MDVEEDDSSRTDDPASDDDATDASLSALCSGVERGCCCSQRAVLDLLAAADAWARLWPATEDVVHGVEAAQNTEPWLAATDKDGVLNALQWRLAALTQAHVYFFTLLQL